MIGGLGQLIARLVGRLSPKAARGLTLGSAGKLKGLSRQKAIAQNLRNLGAAGIGIPTGLIGRHMLFGGEPTEEEMAQWGYPQWPVYPAVPPNYYRGPGVPGEGGLILPGQR